MLDTLYQVNEIFTSIQGEGVHAGVPATFVRLQGCPVGCSWCDTKYTWAHGGRSMSTDEILEQVHAHHVVITGGEPTLYNLDNLIRLLRFAGHFAQMETSGLKALKGGLRPDWITWSPKENLKFNAPDTLRHHVKEVKWVVDESAELEKAVRDQLRFYGEYVMPRDRPIFVFMPEGCPPSEDRCKEAMRMAAQFDGYAGIHCRYGDRLQYRVGVR
jgi:7-carboxy-7-deazaguanine synthase